MKFARLFAMIIALSLLVASTAAYATTYYCTGDGVRIRSEPQNADNIVGKLHYGDKVDVIATKGGWCQIKFKDGVAYVTETFLEKNLEEKKMSSSKSIGLTKKSIKMRKKASSSAKSITTIPKNTVVKIKASNSDWLQIEYDSKEGYVPKDALEKKDTNGKTYLGSYTITYHQNDSGRKSNIKKAVKKLNGTTVKSGSKFSFFKVVGTDYKEATEYGDDDVYVGGGLTHVATTLNKAINNAQHNGANIAVKDKHRNFQKTPYVKKGEEAFVSIAEQKDFTFKNNTGASIKIYALVKGDSVIIMLFRN